MKSLFRWRRSAPPPRPSDVQGGRLFIIGAARSGTTVLQNALNHSPDVYLLGEPNLHLDAGAPGFAARYNGMHRAWLNQETKSTFCPPVLGEDGPWRDYLQALGAHHRCVGAKIVVNPGGGPAWIEGLFTFHCREFYDARYIFTFRHPLAVVNSTRDLQHLSGSVVCSRAMAMANYAETVELFLRCLRTLPHVRAIVHEDVSPEALDHLGRWLAIPTAGMFDYYDAARVRAYDAADFDPVERRHLDLLAVLYEDLRQAIAQGPRLPQIEQNDGNLSPGHYTALGSIARRAAVIAASLRKIDAEANMANPL